MLVKVPCLALKGCRPLFRIAVPKDLRALMETAEIKLSLGALPLSEASKACIVLRRSISAVFAFARRSEMEPHELRPHVQAYYKGLFERIRSTWLTELVATEEPGGEADRKRAYEVRRFDAAAEDLAVAASSNDFSGFVEDAKAIASQSGLGIACASGDFAMLQIECAKAKLEMLDAVSALYHGKHDAEIKWGMERGRKEDFPAERPGEPRVSTVTVAESKPAVPASRSLKFKELYARFMKENSKTWKPSTVVSYEGAFKIYLEQFGHRPIDSIKHRELLDFRDEILVRIPKNPTKYPELADLSLKERAEADEKFERVSTKTVNGKLTALESFLGWCAKHDFIEVNPAKDLQLP